MSETNVIERSGVDNADIEQCAELPPPPRRRRRVPAPALGLTGLLLVLGVWQFAVSVGNVQPTVLPPPRSVLAALFDQPGLLFDNMLYTLRTILVGFALAAVIGFSLAVLFRASRTLDAIATPIIVTFQTVPKIALLPLIVAWFGLGHTTGLVIVVLLTVFPVLVNTRLGLESVHEDYQALGRVMGGSRQKTFWTIEIPLALPAIFGGLEVSMTLAVTGAAAAEFFAGSEGIAFITQVSSSALRMDLAFASLAVLTVMGTGLYYLTKLVAWICMPWARTNS